MIAWMKGEDGSITYKELNEQANQMANLLIEKGVPADNIVGIMMERSLEMIASILGILKAGGAYLPIDPGYPEERINYILADSGAKVLVTTYTLAEEGEKVRRYEGKKNLQIVVLDFSTLPSYHLPQSPWINAPATSLACIIYTFGNGGQPKGVMVEHGNVIRWVKNTNYIDFSQGPCLRLIGNTIFDITTFEIWKVLLNGLGLNLVPGDTTFSTAFRITGEYKEVIPIGKPTANTITYIVDRYNHMVPIGVKGELVVGGDGVARGYLNDPELTSQKFQIPNPKSQTNKSPSGQPMQSCIHSTMQHYPITPMPHYPIYMTGDLARWLPDGNIEFLGRIDHQVKPRGYRIELGEIESQLLTHPDIKAGDTYAAPRHEMEKKLAEIWSEVLEIEKNMIGIDNNFFELGGNSLKATIVTSMVQTHLKITIPLVELFKTPTIRQLSRYINQHPGSPGRDL
jgi:non-ribosomal peptide synthetase component F/acyl carrier protein